MSARDLPVRPDLDQLKHQAKDLLRELHAVAARLNRDWSKTPARAHAVDAYYEAATRDFGLELEKRDPAFVFYLAVYEELA